MKIVMAQFLSPTRPPLPQGYLISTLQADEEAKGVETILLNPQSANYCETAMKKEVISLDPDIVMFMSFSTHWPCSLWNTARTLEVCRLIKEEAPDIKIVLGGSEVEFIADEIMKKNLADIILQGGEIESTFLDLVKAYMKREETKDIKGIIWRKNGIAIKNPPRSATKDINDIPSPYLSGTIDLEKIVSPPLETMRGCPYLCTYCLFRKIFSGVRFFSIKRVCNELKHLENLGFTRAWFVDACFNTIPKRTEDICRAIISEGIEMDLSAEIRADTLNSKSVDLLAKAGFRLIDVGLESTNPPTLKIINRPANLEKFRQGVELAKNTGILVDINIILGLPEETVETLRKTFELAMELDVCTVEPYLLQILPGTDLAVQAEQYGLKYMKESPYLVYETPKIKHSELYGLYVEFLNEVIAKEMIDPDLNIMALANHLFY